MVRAAPRLMAIRPCCLLDLLARPGSCSDCVTEVWGDVRTWTTREYSIDTRSSRLVAASAC
jgi:hypothetical protein